MNHICIKTAGQLVCCLLLVVANAQPVPKDYPVRGEPIPDFRFTNVQHYTKKTFTPGDAAGKWLILDFWNKRCISCVKSFPKVNELQQAFRENILFMLVGQNDTKYNEHIEMAYERYRQNYRLQLAIAYDSILFDRFRIEGTPYIIVIDPDQKVYAITSGNELTKENLTALVQGKKPMLERQTVSVAPWQYEVNAKNRNEQDYLFRSVISINKKEPMTGGWNIDGNLADGFFQLSGASLAQLYNVAYWGIGNWSTMGLYFTHWQQPVIEARDKTPFQHDYQANTGFYNYSLVVPKAKASKAYLMQVMQRDLQNYFGYDVTTETRQMPCWILRATPEAFKKLPSKSTRYHTDIGPAGISGTRVHIETILNHIHYYHMDKMVPFFDSTGLTVPIDIDLQAAMTDMDAVIRALAQHGLILQKEPHPMQVIVVRDAIEPRKE